MVRNIVFDLGNVLLQFKPEQFLKEKGYSSKEVKFIQKEIYNSVEWVNLDLGIISRETALAKILERNPQDTEMLAEAFYIDELLIPIDDNIGLLKNLHEKAFKLFYLTNYHKEAFTFAKTHYNFFQYFTGGVVSAFVKKVKPNPSIYQILLSNYNLPPQETLFIDDTWENVRAAEELCFKTIHLKEINSLSHQLQPYLKK
ncbi:MAG: HAD family phosphatase [Spirochaetia bacterium]|nr:HAD family phosphatase [Spirochaetia bacterium]